MINCAKCDFHSSDFRLFELTGYELNRHGYVTEIYLCNQCLIVSRNSEIDKQLYFKLFNFEEYLQYCVMFKRYKYLKKMEGFFDSVICIRNTFGREVDRDDLRSSS